MLLYLCTTVKIELTDDEIRIIEEDKRNQTKNSNFYRHRVGRIGTSISREASTTLNYSVIQVFFLLILQSVVVNMKFRL